MQMEFWDLLEIEPTWWRLFEWAQVVKPNDVNSPWSPQKPTSDTSTWLNNKFNTFNWVIKLQVSSSRNLDKRSLYWQLNLVLVHIHVYVFKLQKFFLKVKGVTTYKLPEWKKTGKNPQRSILLWKILLKQKHQTLQREWQKKRTEWFNKRSGWDTEIRNVYSMLSSNVVIVGTGGLVRMQNLKGFGSWFEV